MYDLGISLYGVICFTLLNTVVLSQSDQCFLDRLQRCQQEVNLNVNRNDRNYGGASGINNQQWSDQQSTCRQMRSNLECLLQNSPACIARDSKQESISSDTISKAKRYLDQSCDENGGWRSRSCYTRDELRSCENQFSPFSQPVSSESCRRYSSYRNCALNVIRAKCQLQDQDYVNSFLIDKAQELAWKCQLGDIDNKRYPNDNSYPTGQYFPSSGSNARRDGIDASSSYGNYPGSAGGIDRSHDGHPSSYPLGGGNYPGQVNYPSQGNYPGQGSYAGQGNYPNQGLYPSQGVYPLQDGHGYPQGQGNYPGSYPGYQPGVGTFSGQFDQFGSLDGDKCLSNSRFFSRTCDESLLQRQREARNGRTGVDVQRRICCSLFFYHDCLSKVVVQNCRDASPTVVNILLGDKRRDMTVGCRNFSRDQCNFSQVPQVSYCMVIVSLIAVLFANCKFN